MLLLLSSQAWAISGVDEALSNSLYQTVGDLVLKSEDYIVKPSNAPPALDPKKETLKDKAAKFLVTLSPIRQKELLFNLFSKNGKLTATEKSLEDYSLQELNLIIGSDLSRKMSLYQSIDRTETTAGSALLSTMLSAPISDVAVIQKRQRLIKFLLDNENIFDYLNSLIKEVKEGQDSLFNCWNSEAELDENLRNLFYSPKELIGASFFNKSPKKLQLDRMKLLAVWGIKAVTFPPIILGSISATIGFMYTAQNAGARFGIGCIGSLYTGLFIYSEKVILDQARIMNSVLRNMHKRLKDISAIIKSFDAIFSVIRDRKEMYEGCSLLDNMTNFVLDPKTISNDLEYLKNLLNKSVFEQEKFGLFSHAGNVLAAHEYINEVRDAFSLPLEAIGEIDAYLSIVKLIKEHEHKPSGFCFVNFVAQDKPLMQLRGAWSTLVGAENAKPANITLGGNDNQNNAMFTGPNGSGKSILMKAVVTCDILGRTFGIAPAKTAKMTLFKKVYTYVNVQENPRLGQSTFMAQKARGQDILNKLEMNPNENVLIIIDEPYSGTVPDAIDTLTYKLASKIAKYPNAICLLATHSKKPAGLADEKDSNFTNYHFKIVEHSDNSIERTFELMPGRCDWWYNDAARRDRYIKLFSN